jgi:hypothetical protein
MREYLRKEPDTALELVIILTKISKFITVI